ncbi:MAG TPA: long-chain fatty acid--CoA ligase [Streptosporangiaceae bacterium]|nr:long-chain fatty acid--CoA ligase [Streptosporangiaceae bacterium]
MLNEGVGSWTARRARKTPDRIALVHDGSQLTYAALHDRVARLAGALRGLGLRPGDRVAYLGQNHPAFLETMFGTWAAGGVFVPLNYRLAQPELAHQLADSEAAALVYAPAFAATVAGLCADVAVTHFVALDGAGAGGAHGYEDIVAAASPAWTDHPVTLDDPCLIMYTSGTTGRAKGAVLTHGNITWNTVNVLVDTDVTSDAVALVAAPLFHTAALNMLSLPVLIKGGTLVIEPAFDPRRALELIARHRVTVLFGVPAMYDAMAALPDWAGADLSSLRALLCGGAPVPLATIRAYVDRGLSFIQGYGMTEAAPGVLLLDAAHAQSKAGSAGVPHFFADVRIVGPDLRDVAAGEPGEILVAGPNVMRGYWNLREETAQVITDGWLRSGDIARADDDGYVYVADRVKDVIISGGENVYPAEVESALRAHPAVADCGVIGVPDDRWGEVGRAVVVLRPGAEADEVGILAFLDGRIARYKIPRSVRFAAELPRTATGKIAKRALRHSYGAGDPVTG